MSGSIPFDLESYVDRTLNGPCFICELIAGNPAYPHHIIFENDRAIAFLDKYPTLYGYTLVAPKEHREHVTGDFSPAEYLELQQLLYRVAEAVRRATSTERLYLLSLGSQQGNSHVHWHIAPLPPGVPALQQQLEVLRKDDGVLDLSEQEMKAVAARIREELQVTDWEQRDSAHF
jgi:diadenosine tetraphosphate (Ap4A) HIT family hydrolase